MPWLAEILDDETIPEEDRYWLDCRVRAVIARDLHTFFDREGNRIDVTAEGGIRNGEAYWRETFIVEPDYIEKVAIGTSSRNRMVGVPVNDSPEIAPPYYFWRTPGYLLNRYGEKIGDIATTDFNIHLSRDGNLGIYTSGLQRHIRNPSHLFFLNSNNEVIDQVIGPYLAGFSTLSMAEDGSIAIAACSGDGSSWTSNRDGGLGIDYPDGEIMLHVFTGAGEFLHAIAMPGRHTDMFPPEISPDAEYIAYTSAPVNITFLLDAVSGETIYEWDQYGSFNPSFTQNSRYLCVPAVGGARIYDCETGEIMFERPGQMVNNDFHVGLSASNDLSVVTGERLVGTRYSRDIFLNGELYSSEPPGGSATLNVSPNGFFIDRQKYSPDLRGYMEYTAVPYTVLQVKGHR